MPQPREARLFCYSLREQSDSSRLLASESWFTWIAPVPTVYSKAKLRKRFLLAKMFVQELIAEHISILQDPINYRISAKVSSRFLRFDPFVSFNFTGLKF